MHTVAGTAPAAQTITDTDTGTVHDTHDRWAPWPLCAWCPRTAGPELLALLAAAEMPCCWSGVTSR